MRVSGFRALSALRFSGASVKGICWSQVSSGVEDIYSWILLAGARAPKQRPFLYVSIYLPIDP